MRMSLFFAGLVTLAATSACTSLPSAAGMPRGAPYVAAGTEPFWSVSVGGGRILFESPGEPSSTHPLTSEAAAPDGGYRYVARGLAVEVRPAVCSDGMSDRLYADTVTVTMGGAILHGCGTPLAEPDFLNGRRWAIVSIDGETVGGEDYVLEFDGGRLNGRAGCNRITGRYTLDAEWRLAPAGIASTRMACPEPRMAHESALLRLLGGPIAVQLGDGVLSLHGTNNVVVEIRLI